MGILAILALTLTGCGATQAASPTTQAPVATQTSAPAPTPVAKKWVVTNSWKGTGAKVTEKIKVTENTRINWETTNKDGIFQIYVQDKTGAPLAVPANQQGIGKDVSYINVPVGEYTLNINSAFTPWTITVEQQQ